ncbi:ABC transporter ATP-binding protein [Corynebacterium flavescens]|uniref:ABC transporter ATPase n=1 Tax=Corynebacterium flavescens TaxID=28028 RepID=A0AB73B524_CORFL|nr:MULTISPECIES: ABC transporter ATP-binding protein [Corynebacterium]KAA8720073.1 ABC transporter ATP-binding protein [Corynebacterium flavescens]MDN6099265.1 ABC transporter ATP-binding protein [Corynebacterium flavescens]MDN6225440.1 ABC transporter ATP-binding protein [Corynebacterium flavescens]MDN6235823.1 ABC transporter ATP-binding protein [Corynebacterium flavescens]MDN6431405.1 ABC transporter ATP-binding protein [Corynebacterium flavescens]
MIEVEGLTKQYKSVRAVDDLTFKVEPGIVTGFLGPNGAGKSTTMRMILGLDEPTMGQSLVNGQHYSELKHPLRVVGALLDAKAVHPNRSAANHLKWMAQSNGISTSRVDEVLDLVGLSDVAGKKAGGFSLGMGQRLGLAGALLGDPEILILDEPVNGLDPEGIRWVRSLVRALAAEGRTVLISSHLLSEMSLTADHLVVIGRGKLVANQSTYDFVKEHSQSSVIVRSEYLKEFAGALREEAVDFQEAADEEGRPTLVIKNRTTDSVGQLAYSTGVPLNELSLKRASLEDAFMQLTGDSVQYHGNTPLVIAEQSTQEPTNQEAQK